jgi:hypothetical protein
MANDKKRKATGTGSTTTSTPADGYVCNLCKIPGHWIQQCTQAGKNNNKKKKDNNNNNHTPVAGVDPSQDDIDKARELQKIPPPQCFCGIASRLKKVKRSHVGGEESRAIGNYFFFCSKKKTEEPCRFARPVQDEIQPKKERYCNFLLKNGSCKKGDKCMFSHDIPEELLLKNSKKTKKGKKAAKKSKTNDDETNDDDRLDETTAKNTNEKISAGNDKKEKDDNRNDSDVESDGEDDDQAV